MTRMLDLDREQLRKTYQLCRTGFLLLAIALIPACIWAALLMVGMLGDRRFFIWLNQLPWNDWIFTLSVWGSLVGTTLLWGRWDHTSWQRRCGLLLCMCLVDLVLWFLDRGDGPGLGEGSWFRSNLGQALGWAEFALMASLSGDYLVHLGLGQADDSAKSTRSLAATGAVIWMLRFCEQTNWDAGWPLQRRNFGLQGWLLYLGSELIFTIALIQVTALIVASVRQSGRVLHEMDLEDQDHELLRLPSESPRHQDLMATHTHGDSGDQRFGPD
jgi:hypothetical protein